MTTAYQDPNGFEEESVKFYVKLSKHPAVYYLQNRVIRAAEAEESGFSALLFFIIMD